MFDILKTRLNFPRIHKVKLHHFSLYSLEPLITVTFGEGVLCLIGANGLGKSTFLNSINFALTGIVFKPDREFTSTDEFYRFNQSFAEEYFLGRIAQKDHDLAEITLEFELKGKIYSVTRGPFESNELRHLSVMSLDNQHVQTYENISPEELNEEYIKLLTQDIGVASFDQFVFLQSFVFTFDERRELLFWNNKVLEQALYLAFGINFTTAKKADTLRREIERADSLARNANYQATEVRKQINNLEREVETITISKDISTEIEELYKSQSEQQEKVEFIRNSFENYRTQLFRASSQLALLRNQYEEVFQTYIVSSHTPMHHPLLVQTFQSGVCGICGTENESIKERIQDKVNNKICPLCGTNIPDIPQPPGMDQLMDLDIKIENSRNETEELTKAVSRLEAELNTARTQMNEIDEKVKEFEFANESILSQLSNRGKPSDGIAAIQASYQMPSRKLCKGKVVKELL